MGLTGLILIVLGSLCIAKPGPILLTLSWLAGLFIVSSGLVRFISWVRNRASGMGVPVMFSGLFQILLGALFLRYSSILTSTMGIILIVVGVFYFLALFGMTRITTYRGGFGTGGSGSQDAESSEWIDEQ